MEPVTLFLAGEVPAGLYRCGRCTHIWDSEVLAEKCCACPHCGKFAGAWNGQDHSECYAKARERAKKGELSEALLDASYTGPFMVDGNFYANSYEMFAELREDEIPASGFCLEYHPPQLSVSPCGRNGRRRDARRLGAAVLQATLGGNRSVESDQRREWDLPRMLQPQVGEGRTAQAPAVAGPWSVAE